MLKLRDPRVGSQRRHPGDTVVGHSFSSRLPWSVRRSWTFRSRSWLGEGLRVVLRRMHEAG